MGFVQLTAAPRLPKSTYRLRQLSSFVNGLQAAPPTSITPAESWSTTMALRNTCHTNMYRWTCCDSRTKLCQTLTCKALWGGDAEINQDPELVNILRHHILRNRPKTEHWTNLSRCSGLSEHFDSYCVRLDSELKWIGEKRDR